MPVDFQKLAAVVSQPWVVAAWIFGSSQNGTVRPGSDLDIGILADPLPTLTQHLDLQGQLAHACQEDVDLVVLNAASSVLRFEALQGPSLYCGDIERRAVFASLTAREYEDDMALAERGLAAWHEGRATRL